MVAGVLGKCARDLCPALRAHGAYTRRLHGS